MSVATPNWFGPKIKDGAVHRMQSEGYILRGLNVGGTTKDASRVYWRRAGTGEATELAPGMSQSSVMNAGRDMVYADFVDYEANDFVKKADLNKMAEPEQAVVQKTIGMAMGRKFDKIQLAAMDAAADAGDAETIDLSAGAISITDVMSVQGKIFNVGGGSYEYICLLPSIGMQQLELYREFASSDYTGSDYPLLKSIGAKKWRNILFVPLPDGVLTVPAANKMDGYMYVKDAVGFEWNQELSIRADWLPLSKGYFIAGDYAAASKVILPEGVKRLRIATNIALARPNP